MQYEFNDLVKLRKNYEQNKQELSDKKKPNETNNLVYTLKFYTLYLPSSIKKVRLYARVPSLASKNTNNKATKSFGKILIKQSYIMLVWLRYISMNAKQSCSENSGVTPSFFIYPCRKYKFTTIKSPMAHKTFSQEQFLYKNYKLSITFTSTLPNKLLTETEKGRGRSKGLSNSAYLIMFFFKNMPFFSTNMLIIQRLSLKFHCCDSNFFSLFTFSKKVFNKGSL